MNRISAVVLTAVVAMFAFGCGGGGADLGLKEGDKLEVLENLPRERFEAYYGESIRAVTHTNGALMELPKGVILEVFVTPKKDARIVEVVPVKYTPEGGETITDADELRERFVQHRYITHDFLYYSFIIPAEYLGTKVKKVE